VIDPDSLDALRREIEARVALDKVVLEDLRTQVRPLRHATRRIQPRTATSISLVAADGGNNRIQFDPFLVQLIRVVDSSQNEYCLEVVSPSTDVYELSRRQFADDRPVTALGHLMAFLGVETIPQLSHMIRPRNDRPLPSGWVLTYRALVEWAVLFRIVREKDFATDTLIVVDNLLRSKIFAENLFAQMMRGMAEAIRDQYERSRRRLWLVGVAKHSSVLDRYRLAMALEGVLHTTYPAYAEVPRTLEEQTYQWDEWARGYDEATAGQEPNRFVAGKLFFAKFGSSPRDPIWPVDVFLAQADDAPTIFGCLLADARDGFPVAHYPRCLQKAHDHAALVDFDFNILQEEVFRALRSALHVDAPVLDAFRLQEADPAQRRYR
jgi:hypothetical protein